MGIFVWSVDGRIRNGGMRQATREYGVNVAASNTGDKTFVPRAPTVPVSLYMVHDSTPNAFTSIRPISGDFVFALGRNGTDTSYLAIARRADGTTLEATAVNSQGAMVRVVGGVATATNIFLYVLDGDTASRPRTDYWDQTSDELDLPGASAYSEVWYGVAHDAATVEAISRRIAATYL